MVWRCKDISAFDYAVYTSVTNGACGFTNGKALLMSGKMLAQLIDKAGLSSEKQAAQAGCKEKVNHLRFLLP